MKVNIYNESIKLYGYWVDTKYDQTVQKSLAIVIYSDGKVRESYLHNLKVIDTNYLNSDKLSKEKDALSLD